MVAVNSLEEWGKLKALLDTYKYAIWQMQYDTCAPEGFHTWFYAPGRPELEIITRSDPVYDAIVHYGTGR